MDCKPWDLGTHSCVLVGFKNYLCICKAAAKFAMGKKEQEAASPSAALLQQNWSAGKEEEYEARLQQEQKNRLPWR
jgi:hypothetical protein